MLIVIGVGTAFYRFATIIQFVAEGQFRQVVGKLAMKHRIEQLKDHVVICEYRKMGRVVAEEVIRSGGEAVVIEREPAREPELAASGLPYVIGSAPEDRVLEEARSRRARAIVVVTAADADNVFITLSGPRHKSEDSYPCARRVGSDVAGEVIEHAREVNPTPADDPQVSEVSLPQLIGCGGRLRKLVSGFWQDERGTGNQIIRRQQPVDQSFRNKVLLPVKEPSHRLAR